MRAELEDLLTLKPGSANAEALRARLERDLLRWLRREGLTPTARRVTASTPAGTVLANSATGYRRWTWHTDDGKNELRIALSSNRLFKSVNVVWAAVRAASRPARDGARDERQAAFYREYNKIAKAAYGPRPPKLGPRDRTILLIGELEADVNNGGFAQYLGNKGAVRARAAEQALRSVHATKTADLVASAIASRNDDDALDRLTARFTKAPEDLASLTAESVGRGLR